MGKHFAELEAVHEVTEATPLLSLTYSPTHIPTNMGANERGHHVIC